MSGDEIVTRAHDVLDRALKAQAGGERERALEMLQQLVAQSVFPETSDGRRVWAEVHYTIGEILEKSGDVAHAAESFDRAVSFDGKHKRARAKYVELMFSSIRATDGTRVEHYIAFVEVSRDQKMRVQVLGRLQGILRIRLTDKLETLPWRMAQLDALHRVAPDINFPKLYLGRGHYLLGHWRQAIDYLVHLTNTAAETFDVLNILGRAHEKLGEFHEALAAYEKSLRLAPEQAGIHFRIGRIRLHQAQR